MNNIIKFKAFRRMLDILKYSFTISVHSSVWCTYLRVAIIILQSFYPIISLQISKNIINILTYSQSKEQFVELLFCSTLLTIFNGILSKLNSYVSLIHNEKITYHISLLKYEKSVNIDMEYYDSSKYYNEYMNASRNSGSIQAVTWNLVNLIGCIVKLIGILIIFTRYSVLFTLVMIITSIPCGIIEIHHKKVMLNLQKELIPYERKLGYSGSLFSNKQIIPDIKLYGCFEFLIKKFESLWEKRYIQVVKYNRNYLATSGVISFLPQIIILIIGSTIGIHVIEKNMSIGDYTYYTGCAFQVLSGITAFINMYSQINDNTNKVQSFIDFLNWKNRISDTGEIHLEKTRVHKIELSHVSFKYPDTENFILKDVNLSFNTNQKIAIAGVNGAGKSTLIKLLLRFYEPDSGNILIDGINIKEYSLKSLYDFFGVMFQDYNRYSFTLLENIALSNVDDIGKDDLIYDALKKANAISILEKLDNSYNTYLTRIFEENGKELSGGEWQKVALARCFFKKSGIIVLDEPSSSLDAKSENDLFENVMEKCAENNAGLILISHRLSNIRFADQIFVINESSICENGTHDELMQKKGLYFDLYNMQLNKYM